VNRAGAGKSGVILALGSINADFQLRVARRPEISETLVGRDFVRLGGGKAANVAFFARRLGCPVTLFGCVGDDDLAEQALRPLREAGVDLSGVHRAQGSTGVAMIMVPPDGNKGIVLATNANELWTDAMTDQMQAEIEAAPEGSVLAVDCEAPEKVVERAVAAANRRDFAVVLDPSPAERVDRDLLARASAITPNPAEAGQILDREVQGPDAAREAGEALLKSGAGAACMKLSEGGCILVSTDGSWELGSFPVDVVDTTGAGDAFAGALAVGLLRGLSLCEAARLAVAASHLAVGGYGSRAALPDSAELEQAVRRVSVSELT
jgi:ribokinase